MTDTSISAPAFTLEKPQHTVSNLEFVRAIFRDIGPDACVWVCSYGGDPGTASPGDWAGFGIKPRDPLIESGGVLDRGAEGMNTFLTFSSFRGETGIHGSTVFPGRRKALFAAAHAFMIDDIGTGPGAKIPPERLPAVSPSWVLETSPGNWQVGYMLADPLTDGPLAGAFIDALVAEGLGEDRDPGMKGVTRYGRLPRGTNGKKKYRDDRGEAPEHRLLHWRPDRRFSFDALGAAFGVETAVLREKQAQEGQKTCKTAQNRVEGDDPWFAVLALTGRFEGPDDKGADGVWWHMTCPWVHEHTGGVDNGSAYILGQGYKCHHGHCAERTWIDVRDWLLAHEDEKVRGAALAVRAGEVLGEIDLSAPTAAIPPLDLLRSKILVLSPGDTEDYDKLLRDVAGAEFDAADREGLVKDIAQARKITKAAVLEDLKKRERTARAEDRLAQAAARDAQDRSAGKIVWPILQPGDWRDRNEDGEPTPTSRNVETLMYLANGRIRQNLMTKQLVYGGIFKGKSGDWVHQFLADSCEINGLRTPRALTGMIRRIAEDDAWHPFAHFLGKLEWDGLERLRGPGGLYDTVKVEKDDVELRDLILDRWLRSVVAAARHLYRGRRGCQPRGVLVFLGKQFSGKTTWLERLVQGLFPGADEVFCAGAHYSGDTDSVLHLTGALITELGEIDSTLNRVELGKLKAFLSNDSDRLRKPYGYEHENYPRRTVFAGTVNREDFLRDATGNTRFWVIRCTEDGLDLDSQRKLDMPQIWAQVQAETEAGLAACKAAADYLPLPWHMSKGEMQLIEQSNEGHRVVSGPERLMLDVFDWTAPDWIRAQTQEERMRVNPSTFTEIQAACGQNPSIGRTADWMTAIRVLTGQTRAKPTRIILEDADGKKYEKKGRLYAMPPKKNLRNDFSVELPAPGENTH